MLDLLTSYESFLERIFRELALIEVDVSNFELDHICYRVSTKERYYSLCEAILMNNQLLGEATINKRPISSFLLSKALIYKDRRIHVLELPAPKSGSKYSEGYEHVEFVIDEPLEEFKSRYSHISFDEAGYEKNRNRDLRIKFKDFSVKFHEQSLLEVMENEQLNQ